MLLQQKSRSESWEGRAEFRSSSVTSPESWMLIGQFPSWRAIFRSNPEGISPTMASALRSCQDGWNPIRLYLALPERI